MTIDKAIGNHLKQYAGLKILVADRIYSDSAIETCKLFPAIMFSLVSGIDEHTLGTDPAYTEERWQFTIIAKDPESRSNVSKQLKAAFKDFSGVMGGAGGVNIQSVLQENRVDQYYEASKIYMRMVDFMFMYDDV